MRSGIPIGSILGIRVRMHASWFIVLALIVLSLVSVGVPGRELPPVEMRWLLAVLVAALFFLSVLLHELAHALVARRRGLAVSEMTLFIFGGPPAVDRDAPDARSEAIIAVSGPLLSLIIGAAGIGLWLLVGGVATELALLVGGVAWWTGWSNLLLAVFNLVPGFPMDGGRLVRAVLWAATRDFMRATRLASWAGRAFGYGLIAVGLAWALGGELILGIWLAFIGWFLKQAAEGSYRRAEFGRLVSGIAVGDVMDQDVAVVGPNLTLDTLVDQHLLAGQASFYPVTMDGKLVGTVDMAQITRVPRGDWPVTRVTDVMTRAEKVDTLTQPASVMDAMARFDQTGAPAIAVVAEGESRQLLGLVTRDGLVRALRHRAVLQPQRTADRS